MYLRPPSYELDAKTSLTGGVFCFKNKFYHLLALLKQINLLCVIDNDCRHNQENIGYFNHKASL